MSSLRYDEISKRLAQRLGEFPGNSTFGQSFYDQYRNANSGLGYLRSIENEVIPSDRGQYDNLVSGVNGLKGSAIAGGAIAGLTAGAQILNNATQAAQLEDTTQFENQLTDLSRVGSYGYNNFDEISRDYSRTNFNPSISYDDIRVMSTGEKIGNVGSSALSGAAAGMQIGGPWGCVCAGTRVITNYGRFVNIEHLTKDDGIIGWDGNGSVCQTIYEFQSPSEKECVKILFDNGEELCCSIDHPILYHKPGRCDRKYINGKRVRVPQYSFVNASTLKPGDIVASISEIPVFGNSDISHARLLGMLIGDGTYGDEHGARLFSGDPATWDYIESNNYGELLNDFKDSPLYNNEFRAYRIFNGAELMRSHGIYGQAREEKRLPLDISKFSKQSLAEFIAGLFDTDGCVPKCTTKKDKRIEFAQSNKILLSELKEQLLKFGIHSFIRCDKAKICNTRHSNKEYNSKPCYKLIIKDAESVRSFYENIPLLIEYKKKNLIEAHNYKCSVIKRRPRYFGAYPIKVKSVEPIGIKTIYNLQADDYHTYIANGIITHNSLIGGVIGAGASLAGILTGDRAASVKETFLNNQADMAAGMAQDNLNAAHERILNRNNRQGAVHAVAKGGQIERKSESIKAYADRVLSKPRVNNSRCGRRITRSYCDGGVKYRVRVK